MSQQPAPSKKSLLEQKGGESIMLRGPSFMKPVKKLRRSTSPPGGSGATGDAGSEQTGTSTTGAAAPPRSPQSAPKRGATPPPPPLQHQPTMLTTGPKLIPPAPPNNDKLYTVVLDLDETVVFARDGPLYARAHLKDLLRTMHKYCEVIVWTAGERAYAKAILKEINCENIIQHLVYRHRKWFDPKDYTKDLGMLGRSMDYVLIIENTPDCIRENPQNGIIVEDFEGITSEEAGRSTSVAPACSLGADSKAGRDDTDADAHVLQIEGEGDAVDEEEGVTNSQPQAAAAAAAGPASSSPQPAEEKPKRRRKAKDNTLLYLMEIVEQLGTSGGATVPDFLSRCSLLKRQVVLCNDSSGGAAREVPIFFLPSKRRPAGSELKVVRLNRDRQPQEAIGKLPARLIAPVAATAATDTATPSSLTSSSPPTTAEGGGGGGGSGPSRSQLPELAPLSTPPLAPAAAREQRDATGPTKRPRVSSAQRGSSPPPPRSPKSKPAGGAAAREAPDAVDGGDDAPSTHRMRKE